jgi:3-oxoacyl-[acyl-carrier protein] reductase
MFATAVNYLVRLHGHLWYCNSSMLLTVLGLAAIPTLFKPGPRIVYHEPPILEVLIMDICGKTALVTGASRGIGKAISLEFAHQGVEQLLLVARNRQNLEAVAAEVEALGVKAVILPLDLTNHSEVSVVIAQAWRDYGPIHMLINCAGVAHQMPFLHSNLPNVQSEINTNLMGMYAITRQVARRMVARQEGTIVNVSSLMGKIAAPTMATYSATKFAIVGFTQALRGELADHQVKVLALLPSLTDTEMVEGFQPFRWMVKMSPKQVAKALMAGLQKDSLEIAVGWQSHLALLANRVAPQLVERFVQLAAPGSKLVAQIKSWLIEARLYFRDQGDRLRRSQV